MNNGNDCSLEVETIQELSGHYTSASIEYIMQRIAINLAVIADQLTESNGYVLWHPDKRGKHHE